MKRGCLPVNIQRCVETVVLLFGCEEIWLVIWYKLVYDRHMGFKLSTNTCVWQWTRGVMQLPRPTSNELPYIDIKSSQSISHRHVVLEHWRRHAVEHEIRFILAWRTHGQLAFNDAGMTRTVNKGLNQKILNVIANTDKKYSCAKKERTKRQK